MTGMPASYSPLALSFAFLFPYFLCILMSRRDVGREWTLTFHARRLTMKHWSRASSRLSRIQRIVASSPSARIAVPGAICLRVPRLTDWVPASVITEKAHCLQTRRLPFLAAWVQHMPPARGSLRSFEEKNAGETNTGRKEITGLINGELAWSSNGIGRTVVPFQSLSARVITRHRQVIVKGYIGTRSV